MANIGAFNDNCFPAADAEELAGPADTGTALRGGVPRFHRRFDHECGTAPHPYVLALLGAEPAVGAFGVPADLRRVHAARRPAPPPAWAAPRASWPAGGR